MADNVKGQSVATARKTGLVIGLLTALMLLVAPAAWAGPAPSTEPATTQVSGTWVGQVEAHEDHFDYVGSPCPIEAEFCIQTISQYRLVPMTEQARKALPIVVGKQAKLQGNLYAADDGEHDGTLFVYRVTAPR